VSTVLERLRRAAALVRRIIGVPDYDIYATHMARCHPDQAPLSREEFHRVRLNDKYNTPGSRCC
jgi:uncharacterized short protein YbdD (DUF466 family)